MWERFIDWMRGGKLNAHIQFDLQMAPSVREELKDGTAFYIDFKRHHTSADGKDCDGFFAARFPDRNALDQAFQEKHVPVLPVWCTTCGTINRIIHPRGGFPLAPQEIYRKG